MLGKYEISDASSPIRCIELTRAGEYIVTKNPAKTKGEGDLDLNDVWAFGKFTFVDGAYILQGFGKFTIDLLSGGAAEIFIDSGGWDPFTVHANLASTVQETTINRSLCRHWVFKKTFFSLSFSDLPLMDFSFELPGCDFSKWFEKTGDEEGEQELEKECKGLIRKNVDKRFFIIVEPAVKRLKSIHQSLRIATEICFEILEFILIQACSQSLLVQAFANDLL